MCPVKCDYHKRKAYRYLKCEWMKDNFLNEISKELKYCFFKSRVTPSIMMLHTMYHVCVAVEKDGENPGGSILSGYCA